MLHGSHWGGVQSSAPAAKRFAVELPVRVRGISSSRPENSGNHIPGDPGTQFREQFPRFRLPGVVQPDLFVLMVIDRAGKAHATAFRRRGFDLAKFNAVAPDA